MLHAGGHQAEAGEEKAAEEAESAQQYTFVFIFTSQHAFLFTGRLMQKLIKMPLYVFQPPCETHDFLVAGQAHAEGSEEEEHEQAELARQYTQAAAQD